MVRNVSLNAQKVKIRLKRKTKTCGQVGICLILLDVEVTSENALNWTVYDLDENGKPKGLYSDPYVFRIDGMYRLQEKESLPFLNPRGWFPMFFDCYNMTDEHPFAYRILPGETHTYTLGFLVGTNWYGEGWQLSDLWIDFPFGVPDSNSREHSLIELYLLK